MQTLMDFATDELLIDWMEQFKRSRDAGNLAVGHQLLAEGLSLLICQIRCLREELAREFQWPEMVDFNVKKYGN